MLARSAGFKSPQSRTQGASMTMHPLSADAPGSVGSPPNKEEGSSAEAWPTATQTARASSEQQ